IKANVKGLTKLIGGLKWEPKGSEWSDYGETCTYSDEESREKAEFVRETAGKRQWPLAWDIGCNDGRYSRLAAEHADYTVAVDIEFPTREDPMVQRLLAGKREETHADYDLPGFERLLGEAFEIDRRVELQEGKRVIFEVHSR